MLKLLPYLKENLFDNLERFDNDQRNGKEEAKKKTLNEYGDGLLTTVLKKDWMEIPSIVKKLDLLTVSESLVVYVYRINSLKNDVNVESKAEMPGKILLHKIFSNS